MYQNNIKRLPDAYYKGTDGNNYKLLYLNEQIVSDFDNDLKAVHLCLDIAQATGATLDLYGKMVNQHRGTLNDEQYRLLILNKIGKNICQGDYNSVVALLAQMFSCDKSQIVIIDHENTLKVELQTFPLEVLINAGFSGEQAVTIIKSLLPVCVSLTDVVFQGTFEFGDTVTWQMLENRTYNDLEELTYEEIEGNDYDEDKGFSEDYVEYDAEDDTIGGYLGLSIEESTFDLPI